MTRDHLTQLAHFALILAFATAGAFAARALGLPIPFLLGSLVASAALSMTVHAQSGRRLRFPARIRPVFIATIGVMIGTTFDPGLIAAAGGLALSLGAIVPFVALAWSAGFLIFRHVAGYDPITCIYASMPGGLVEAVTLGEEAGADAEMLSLQHFARIVLIVVGVPMMFLAWTGEAVGSAAGQSLERVPADLLDWAAFLIFVPAGLWFGKLARLPAAQLIGPLTLTAFVHALGLWHLDGPAPLLNAAQLVIGAGLGTRFASTPLRRLVSGFAYGTLSVTAMLAIGIGFAALLHRLAPIDFRTMVVSFAPGGVTEMSLIALSIGASPVVVAAHHLFRIFLSVTAAGVFTRRINGRGS